MSMTALAIDPVVAGPLADLQPAVRADFHRRLKPALEARANLRPRVLPTCHEHRVGVFLGKFPKSQQHDVLAFAVLDLASREM